MLDTGHAPGDHPKWVEVSPERPCPICLAVSSCTTQEGGVMVHCHGAASEAPAEGGGWLHLLPFGTDHS